MLLYVYIYILRICTYAYLLLDWNLVERFLGSLCSVLPHNYQLTIDKLKTIPQLLKNGGEQLSKLISSSSADVRKINEKIITYLIVKLCYNDNDTSLVRLCDVMDESIASNETPACLQEIRYGTYVRMHVCTYICVHVCMYVCTYSIYVHTVYVYRASYELMLWISILGLVV